MSNPSFSNIDLWLFELAEGNLTPSQIEQLELFLLQHPEFDVDRDVWNMTKVDSAEVEYANKEDLRKRKPIGWYTAIGATAVLLLIGFGAVNYFNGDVVSQTITAKNPQEIVKQKLLQEIKQIRSNYSHMNSGLSKSNSDSEKTKSLNSEESLANSETQSSVNSRRIVTGNQITSPIESTNSKNYIAHSNQSYQGRIVNGVNELIGDLKIVGISQLDHTLDKTIATYDPKNLEVIAEDKYDVLASHTNQSRVFSTDDYKVSFKSKLNKFGRALQRMMDNPIALKNYRDPHYHVPGMLPNDVNFSSTGTMLSTRVQAISRLQWYGQENEQLISQLSFDGYAYGMRGGVGLQINHAMYNDGKMNIASAALTYSPKISLTKKISLEPSLRFKMGNKSFKNSMMQEVDMVELDRNNAHEFFTSEGDFNGNDLWYKDLGAGLMVNTEWFFIGAQVDNLFRHKDNIYSHDVENPRKAGYHFVGTIGTDWTSKRENVSLSPYFVYQNMENLSEGWLGANLRLNWFTLGGAISTSADPSASIGMKFKHFAMTYNADYTKSAMTGNRALSHQLTLRFVSKPSRFGRRILNL